MKKFKSFYRNFSPELLWVTAWGTLIVLVCVAVLVNSGCTVPPVTELLVGSSDPTEIMDEIEATIPGLDMHYLGWERSPFLGRYVLRAVYHQEAMPVTAIPWVVKLDGNGYIIYRHSSYEFDPETDDGPTAGSLWTWEKFYYYKKLGGMFRPGVHERVLDALMDMTLRYGDWRRAELIQLLSAAAIELDHGQWEPGDYWMAIEMWKLMIGSPLPGLVIDSDGECGHALTVDAWVTELTWVFRWEFEPKQDTLGGPEEPRRRFPHVARIAEMDEFTVEMLRQSEEKWLVYRESLQLTLFGPQRYVGPYNHPWHCEWCFT